MKFGFVTILLCAFSHFANGQTTTESPIKVEFGIESSISTGYIHALTFGGSVLIRKRHGIGLAISGFPPTNPYKGTWGKGVYFDYSYFMSKKKSKRMRAYLCSAIQTMNYRTQNPKDYKHGSIQTDYHRNVFCNIIGFGTNVKLLTNFYLKVCLSIFTVGYFSEEYRIKNFQTGRTYLQEYDYFYYNDFSTFSLDDLTLRFALNYNFK